MTWWGDSRCPCWFWLNILKLIQKWQGGSSSFGEIYRYVFVRFMSLCKSVYMFYTRTGRTVCVCVQRATVSVTRHACARVCLSACFSGLNPRTVPHLSLNKFRALLGYRGVVLGLNVSDFFCSLGTSNGARAAEKIIKPEWVADILAHLGHLFSVPAVSVFVLF